MHTFERPRPVGDADCPGYTFIRRSKILRQDDFLRGQIVLVGYTHGLPYGGHLASCLIMSCIMNRIRAGWGTHLEVLQNLHKFSATIEQPKLVFPSIWEPSFVRLLHEIEAIYDNTQDYAKGGMFWADLRHVESRFFLDIIIGQPELHPRIVDMGPLTIFK
jgi:hypothetical protein